MKTTIYRLLVTVLLIPSLTMAQQSDPDATQSFGYAGLQYLSNNVYLGRKDSAGLSYITPLIGYHHRSGFYIQGGASYAPASTASRIDVVSLEAGYDFSLGSQFNGGFYAGKYFYDASSYAIRSEVNTSAGAYAQYDPGVVSLEAGISTQLGSATDWVAEGGLSREVDALDNRLSFTPGFKFNAGTQNFYDQYYKHGRSRNVHKRNRNGGGGATAVIQVVSANAFTIMDYEASLPVKYETNRWRLTFTPTYFIPVHPATLKVNNVLTSEALQNSWVVQLEAVIKF
ncbi:MAG TPA: hypothetical protein VG870_00830 [Chitinophagaceae bacterium]|nr:hypothetical protein [Chitinophagaceae bacterium]